MDTQHVGHSSQSEELCDSQQWPDDRQRLQGTAGRVTEAHKGTHMIISTVGVTTKLSELT